MSTNLEFGVVVEFQGRLVVENNMLVEEAKEVSASWELYYAMHEVLACRMPLMCLE